MAGHGTVLSRSSTCLSCLRRLAWPSFDAAVALGGSSASNQTRAKSTHLQPHDQGVVVRLLEDIPRFGRKHAIFRVERGRMRNEWYPANKAEYMTGIRFQQLGLSRHEVGERDRGYAPLPPSANVNRELVLEVKTTTLQSKPKAQPKPERAPAPVLPSEPEPAVVAHLPTAEARVVLMTRVPETLTFTRKTVARGSPSVSSMSTVDGNDPLQGDLIFGSVTPRDVLAQIRGFLDNDVDARRISLEAKDISFANMASKHVKHIGRYEVAISVGANSEPIRKIVEVLAE